MVTVCLAVSIFFPEWLFKWTAAVLPQRRRNGARVPHSHGFLINSFNNELTDEQGRAGLFDGAKQGVEPECLEDEAVTESARISQYVASLFFAR